MTDALEDHEGTVSIGGRTITNLRFADDIDGLVGEEEELEIRCYRKMLRVSYKDHVTKEEVRANIQQAIGPHEDLLTMVKRRTLQWYGHVSHSSGLAKPSFKEQ